jgi:hypothetical protein
VAELLRGGARRLNNDGNRALLRIVAVDGNGDALALLIHPQDDKLAGLGLFGDQRRLDLVQRHGGPQGLFSYDLIHFGSFFPNLRIFRSAQPDA